MIKKIGLVLVICAGFVACQSKDDTAFVDDALKYCATQTERTLLELKGDSTPDYTMMPRNVLQGENKWNLRKAAREEWTSGFWSGVLWYDYEATGDPVIKQQAEHYTESLKFLSESSAFDHDLGFLVYLSYGNAYRLTSNPAYKSVLLRTADTLATLFNPTVGTILSWPREVSLNGWPHNTIIDNMINLELLFWAAKHGENKNLYDIAVSHADVTMKHHFKSDLSCYHVAVYDTIDGHFIQGLTHQGYSDESMWARGQGWAIYGYTVCYRETKDMKYLNFAQQLADAYLVGLPTDMVPYWDFNDPAIPNAPRDASAAAVAASGLLEMSTYLKNGKSAKYRTAAIQMLKSLSSEKYQSRDQNPSFLLHSTGHKPAGSEIDASIIYADYYYIEALVRLNKLQSGNNVLK